MYIQIISFIYSKTNPKLTFFFTKVSIVTLTNIPFVAPDSQYSL